jgi:hypothetical protein
MSVTATTLDATSEAYVAAVLETIEEHGQAAVLGAFVIGSGANGTFDLETSDIDLIAVVDRPLSSQERAAVVTRLKQLRCPARALDLVVYVRGSQPPAFELNINADARGAAEKPNKPAHWFVIDAALAQERAVPFAEGPQWSEFFDEISEDRLLKALDQSIEWAEAQPPSNEFARLHAIRSRHYLEHGKWMSKREATR